MFDYNHFYESYPRYKNINNKDYIQKLFELLTEPESINKMIYANDIANKSALSGVINEVEIMQSPQNGFDLNVDMTKQLVGSMVKEVLTYFGYVNDMSKKFGKDKSNFFTKAMRFKKDSELARYEIVVNYEIVKLR